MTNQTLSAERARELFSYDPLTGVLTRKITTSTNAKAGSVAGSPQSNGYLRVRVGPKLHHAHRLAWLLHTGSWPENTIDHINGARSDNRIANLRDLPKAVNNQNRRGPSTRVTRTGLAGVSPTGERFMAKVTTDRRQEYLGTFDTPEDAHQAYLIAKRERHVACTI